MQIPHKVSLKPTNKHSMFILTDLTSLILLDKIYWNNKIIFLRLKMTVYMLEAWRMDLNMVLVCSWLKMSCI